MSEDQGFRLKKRDDWVNKWRPTVAEGVERFTTTAIKRFLGDEVWVRCSDYRELEEEADSLSDAVNAAEAQRNQARQEVLEEVAAEFSQRAEDLLALSFRSDEERGALNAYDEAASHCRSLATLDPSKEGAKDADA